MTRLFLCEKPSQARDIARVLGAARKGEGCLFGDGVSVTWCFGHLLEMATPEAYGERYKRWDLATLPILPSEWQLAPKRESSKQLRAVGEALKKAREVVIATDADREGETIAREILDRFRWRGPLHRLWLSALDEASVRKALAALLPGERTAPLYQAGLGHSRADWLVGMNLTRAYTVLGRQSGYSGVLSVGRVQTPTLRLVVDRDRTIEAFVPVPYWEVIGVFQSPDGTSIFRAKWQPSEAVADPEGRCLNEHTARTLAQQIQGGKGNVREAETKRLKDAPPLLFDLGTLQQEASRRWGMGAKEVLDTAQALYETHKATTYPRTDCSYLPESQFDEAAKVLEALQQSDPRIASLIQKAQPTRRSRVWNDAKISAHHAIIPTAAPIDVDKLSESELLLYDLIRRRYLAQFYPRHEYEATLVRLDVSGEVFVAKGWRVLVPGWRELFGREDDKKAEDAQALPALKKGDRCPLEGAQVLACQTKPPARFTEGTLIAAMKHAAKWVENPKLKRRLKATAGLGTEATRAGIIQTLLGRHFIDKRKKALVSTEAGRSLIDALPPPVKDPATTALWEQALDDIALGHGDLKTFLLQQTEWVRQLIERVRTGATLELPADKSQHACPDCGKAFRRRKGRTGFFWGCSGYPECTTTLPDQRGKPGKRPTRELLGACACGGKVLETPRAWSCETCKAIVWKEAAGKRLGANTALALFAGKTVHLAGLKSRQGKRFEADARLVEGQLKFLFGETG